MAARVHQWQQRHVFIIVGFATISVLLMGCYMYDALLHNNILSFGYSNSHPLALMGSPDVVSYRDMEQSQFRSDGTFKIGIFENLHFGEGEDNRK